MARKDIVGRTGEQIAADHLEAAGYRIIDRNWRCRAGELDIVAERDCTVVFVEVKTRSGTGYGHPLESITAHKLARLRRLAAAWCAENGPVHAIRLDAIAVVTAPGQTLVEHVEQVA
ncbi:YraN family protein [Microcella alkaliphila]|nr:YraN family protein [Microcella alkaliphila]